MNVLTTSQPVNEQLSLDGGSKYATVAAAGASLSGSQRTTSGLNPGLGAATFTLTGTPITPAAGATYLVTAEALMNIGLAATLTLEILVDGVPQAIGPGGTTSVVRNMSPSFQTLLTWSDLLAVAPGVAHTWAMRLTLSASAFASGGACKLLLTEYSL
jgi:hypothetical protein